MLSGRATRMVAFLYHALFKDIERWNDISLFETEKRFFVRLEQEKFSFVSKVLPTLGKALDNVLSGGTWTRPAMFKAKSSTDVRPALFFELFEKVLDCNGFVIKSPSITAVKDIRQIAGLFYKYELPFEDSTLQAAWEKVKETDKSLRRPVISRDLHKILDLARILLQELLCGVDPKSGIPDHGPGACVEGLPNWEKSLFEEIPTQKALKCFGFEYFLHTPRDAERSMSKHGNKMHYKRQVRPVSVFSCVPKDSRGPRSICKESVSNQYLQQGTKNVLYDLIERHPLTAGHVNFTDQSINGLLALWGSLMERDIVTLDMVDASSRIAWWLVQLQFPANWVEVLDATRSERISGQGQEYGPIRMFAPMGSALSFPIESLIHWSLVVSSITLVSGLDINDVLDNVYVYGDDIVLRGLPHRYLFPIFEKLGMRFNTSKCCTGGYFRESCGCDAFRGELVNPLRIKKPILSSGSPETLVAAVSYANSAFDDGLHSLAGALQDVIAELWPMKIPYTLPDSDALGYYTVRKNGSAGYQPLSSLRSMFYDRDTQVIKHNCRGVKGKSYKGSTDWCRYRDTLRSLAARRLTVRSALDSLFPGQKKMVGQIDEPVYRHSLFVTKIKSECVLLIH